jgi:hypothetical protein
MECAALEKLCRNENREEARNCYAALLPKLMSLREALLKL